MTYFPSAFAASLLLFISPMLFAQSTSTTLSATPTSSAAGTPVALTANVITSGGTATPLGSVTFFDGATSLGSGVLTSSAVVAPKTIPASQLLNFIAPNATGTLVTADINGDGKLDAVSYNGSAFQVLMNTGAATYTAATVQSYGLSQPVFLDFDHDGKTDILTLNGKTLQLLKGDGSGSFAAPVNAPGFSTDAVSDGVNTAVNFGFTALASADLRGTGLQDVLIGEVVPENVGVPQNGSVYNSYAAVSTYRNNGNGTFTRIGRASTGLEAYYPTAGKVTAIQTAKLNSDALPDVLAGLLQPYPGNSAASVVAMMNYGDGTLHAPSASMQGGSSLQSVAAGDFNGDGKADVAINTPNIVLTGTNLALYAGTGDGTYQSFNTNVNVAAAIVVDDLDGDGKADLVDSKGIGYLSNGDFTFTQTGALAGSAATAPLLAADLNGDGITDVFFSGTTPVVLLGQRAAAVGLSKIFVAGTHNITAFYAGSGSFTASTSPIVAVTVIKATPKIVGTSSATALLVTTPVTLSVKVTAPGLTPTGTVTFTSGNATLGTATLDASGNASIAYTFSTAGTQTITATYVGDDSTAAGAVTITATTVNAFAVSSSGGSTTLTTARGGTATSAITVASQNGFSGNVVLACSGLPAGVSCAFSPASVTVTGTASGSSMMTVSVGSTVSILRSDDSSFMLAGLCLLCIAGEARRRRVMSNALLALTASIAVLGIAGCSDNASKTSTEKSYSFNVTATAGTAQSSTAYTLNVQ